MDYLVASANAQTKPANELACPNVRQTEMIEMNKHQTGMPKTE